MKNLLKADFSRLLKNKAFLFTAVITLAISLYYAISAHQDMIKAQGSINYYPLEFIPAIAFLVAICTAFFSGSNFSSHTVRNKLSCGYSKVQIYLSNSIVSAVVSVLYCAIYSIVGIDLIKHDVISAGVFFAMISIGALSIIAAGAMATFFAFIIRGKAVPGVLVVLLLAGMMFLSSYLGSKLGEPEFIYEMVAANTTSNAASLVKSNVSNIEEVTGVTGFSDDETYNVVTSPNPNYLTGNKKEIIQLISELIPTSHLTVVSNISVSLNDEDGIYFTPHYSDNIKIEKATDVYKYSDVYYSLGFLIFLTALGAVIFKREQLS